MNVGLPGAGIGGLFYLASTIALPIRSAWRRFLGHRDGVPVRIHLLTVGMVLGIVTGLWLAGWLLSFVVPKAMLIRVPAPANGGVPVHARTVLSMATFAAGVVTLLAVLAAVEVARLIHRGSRPARTAEPRL